MNDRFTPDQIAWLREHAPGTPFAQLTDEFNRVFGQSRSRVAIVSACFYRGFGNGMSGEGLPEKGKKYRFKPGHAPANKGIKGYVTSDPQKLANMQKTQFKKGQQAANYLPVGSIRYQEKTGCLIKVQDNGAYNERWKPAGRFLWNKHHPEDQVQKTDRIIYADGNPQNLDRDNLIKLSGAEYVAYTHLRSALIDKKRDADPDALRAVITLAKIRSRLREKRKNRG